MLSKPNKSHKQLKPAKRAVSIYLTEGEFELVRKAKTKQHRSVANYIVSVLMPQAEKDAK
jgi:hypothetical protein